MIKLIILMVLIPMISFAQHERTEHWQERTNLFIGELDSLPKGKIVFLGNSITEGFDLEHYFPDALPINRGISGDHTDGLLERLEYSVISLKPSQLFILIGINDIGAGDPSSLILKNYYSLIEKLAETLPNSKIYIQSVLPTTQQWTNCPKDKIILINQKILEYCIKFKFTWIDLHTKFVTNDGYLNNSLTEDGLHLNDTGYALWAKVLRGYISVR